jgi:hypothetical protein
MLTALLPVTSLAIGNGFLHFKLSLLIISLLRGSHQLRFMPPVLVTLRLIVFLMINGTLVIWSVSSTSLVWTTVFSQLPELLRKIFISPAPVLVVSCSALDPLFWKLDYMDLCTSAFYPGCTPLSFLLSTGGRLFSSQHLGGRMPTSSGLASSSLPY